jgi:hypothetical protein
LTTTVDNTRKTRARVMAWAPFRHTYVQIGGVFIAWLDALTRGFGLELGAIYFDAALPARKRPVRLRRYDERANN